MAWKITNDDDEAFAAAIRALDRDEDWKRFAIAGRTMAALTSDRETRRMHAPERLRAHPAEDRRAWLWGFRWEAGSPPPEDCPVGACPQCWRLGEPCHVHYRGLTKVELLAIAIQKLDTIVESGELKARRGDDYVSVDAMPVEQLQDLLLGAPACEATCEFPGCFVAGCVKAPGETEGGDGDR